MQFLKQLSSCDCGNICYVIIVRHLQDSNFSPYQAIKETHCTNTGTPTYCVKSALEKRKIPCHLVDLDVDYKDYFHILDSISKDNIIYLCGEFRDKSKTKDRVRQHAVVAFKGLIYDPSENGAIPIENYFHIYTKSLKLKTMILIENH